jgi:hypothetical protein
MDDDTPFFGPWICRLAPMGSRTAQALARARACTLCQLENCFGSWLPQELFPKACQQANSRDRHYTRWRTFWCWLWQNLNPQASCREVVRQLQALFGLEGGPQISEQDGAYCRARARLPLSQFPKAVAATARVADQMVPALNFLKDRPLKVVDGSALTLLADTTKNRAAYPPIQCQPNQPSFPMMRFVVLFSLLSGAILGAAHGSLAVSELSLLAQLSAQLAKADILIGDRGFGCFPVIAWLQNALGVDFIGRTTRRIDGRRRLKPPQPRARRLLHNARQREEHDHHSRCQRHQSERDKPLHDLTSRHAVPNGVDSEAELMVPSRVGCSDLGVTVIITNLNGCAIELSVSGCRVNPQASPALSLAGNRQIEQCRTTNNRSLENSIIVNLLEN